MRILIDTNIILSAALFPDGIAAKAFFKALGASHQAIICDYILDELHRKFQEKFPNRAGDLERFLEKSLPQMEVIPTPTGIIPSEKQLRDIKDQPILRDAIRADADFILTGDKDFLEAGLEDPMSISARDFLAMDV